MEKERVRRCWAFGMNLCRSKSGRDGNRQPCGSKVVPKNRPVVALLHLLSKPNLLGQCRVHRTFYKAMRGS